MLGVGDDRRAVGEDELVAPAVRHHRRRGDHGGGTAIGAEQPVADGHLTHRRPAVGGGQWGVECQRLAHGRPGREDDHLPGVQAVGQLVEVDEPGRHADHLAAPRADRLDLVERALHDRGEREVVLRRTTVGDGVDLGLRGVDHVVGVAVAGEAHLHDLGAGLDEPAQHRCLAHDPRVVARVGGGGDRGDQRVEVGRAADPGELAALLQLGGHGDGVGRLAPPVEVEDRLVDQLVCGAVEVVPAHDLDDVGDRVLGQQHAAENGLLGRDILRRGAFELGVRGRAGKLRNTHRTPTPLPSLVGRPVGPSRTVGSDSFRRQRADRMGPGRPTQPGLWTSGGRPCGP